MSAARLDETARGVFDVYLPLLRYEAQPGVGLAVRKELPTLTSEDRRELDRLVARLERRLKA
ncbi:MAG TPA: hypothetical protein VGL14_17275 [Methylomirabilota bacterium]|jgi:4-hydroxy-tetrahydrodipicolinate synthase